MAKGQSARHAAGTPADRRLHPAHAALAARRAASAGATGWPCRAPRDDPARLAAAVEPTAPCCATRLRALVARPEVREAIFVASPALEASIAAWLDQPDERARRRRPSAAWCATSSRMAARPTPFGLFAGNTRRCARRGDARSSSPPRDGYRRLHAGSTATTCRADRRARRRDRALRERAAVPPQLEPVPRRRPAALCEARATARRAATQLVSRRAIGLPGRDARRARGTARCPARWRRRCATPTPRSRARRPTRSSTS